jgi:glucose-6-phosphate 1-dehydrogenase
MNKAKSYLIKFEAREEYLYVLVGGEKLSVQIANQYWDEIAAERRNQKKTKILIEKDFTHSVSLAEMYAMGINLGNKFKGRKIAFLDRYGNEDVNDFGQLVAENQGVKLKVFTKIDDAEKWLIAD